MTAAGDLLAALLAEPQRIGQAVRIAGPRRMPNVGLECIYRAMAAVHESNEPVTLESVTLELKARDLFQYVGPRLVEIADREVNPERVPEYARAVLNGHSEELRADAARDAPWDAPIPVGADVAGPELALEVLPSPVREHVEAVAEVVDIAPDFVAACDLGVLGAAGGRRAEVAIGETHVEPVNLYMLPALGPGERKVALRTIAAPLEAAEGALAEEKHEALLRNQAERAVATRRCDHLERTAARAQDPGERAAAVAEVAELRASMPEELVPPRLLIDDATPEATARVLAEQGGVCAVVSEEAGSLFEVLAGKYQQGQPALDVHLKAYDGGEVRVHRISREPLRVPGACLSIVTTPQPTLLDRIAELPDFHGRGLLGRLCIVLPESRVGTRMYRNRRLPEAVEQSWHDLVLGLARRPVRRVGEVPRIRLEGEALDVWARYADAMERAQAEGGRYAGIRDWASKHAGRAARIAGLLHLVRYAGLEDPWTPALVPEDVAAAWAVADWLAEHALVAYERMGSTPEERLARRVLRWLRERGHESVSLRDVHRAHQDVGRADALHPALEVLEGRGYLRRLQEPERRPQGGRPPSRRWAVHPELRR